MQPSTGNSEQQLKELLSALGHADTVDHSILYPGHRRQQLIRSLVSRMLGGQNIENIPLAGHESLEGMAEDERFAERCRVLLKMLNAAATAEQIRGCSGYPEQDTALLLELAQLVQVMEQQRASNSSSSGGAGHTAQQSSAGAAVSQLLGHSCSQLTKLTSDAMQLFASDMNDVLKTYSDQGAVQQLPRLQQQASNRAQQIQQQLQQMMAAGGGSCEGAGSEQWQQQVGEVESSLDRLLVEMRQFDSVYQQELSVWAEVASEQHLQGLEVGLHPAALGGPDSTLQVAASVGQAARRIVAAYQGLSAALEGFGCIMNQHRALQDVPAGMLHEQTAVHSEDARRFSSAAATLRPAVT